MRERRLNGRYRPPEVAIQSKYPTNVVLYSPKKYGFVHHLSAIATAEFIAHSAGKCRVNGLRAGHRNSAA
jgi:hypothetical protein